MALIYTLRRAKSEDADALFELVQQFATSFKPERTAFELSWQQLLKDENAWIGVAEYQDDLIGY